MSHWNEDFERCSEWIECALVVPGVPMLRLEDVRGMLTAGEAQLHTTPKGCIVTCIDEYPCGTRIMSMLLAGGELLELLVLADLVEEWGRQEGCTHVRLEGRKGWERALASRGYRSEGIVLSKELGHGLREESLRRREAEG